MLFSQHKARAETTTGLVGHVCEMTHLQDTQCSWDNTTANWHLSCNNKAIVDIKLHPCSLMLPPGGSEWAYNVVLSNVCWHLASASSGWPIMSN